MPDCGYKFPNIKEEIGFSKNMLPNLKKHLVSCSNNPNPKQQTTLKWINSHPDTYKPVRRNSFIAANIVRIPGSPERWRTVDPPVDKHGKALAGTRTTRTTKGEILAMSAE